MSHSLFRKKYESIVFQDRIYYTYVNRLGYDFLITDRYKIEINAFTLTLYY